MGDRGWMQAAPEPTRSRFDPRLLLSTSFGLIVLALGVMWAVEIIDSLALDDRLQGNGIRPRRLDGIDGIVWAPVLHGGWRHLISNTVPFAALGALVALRGMRRFLIVTAVCVVVGGGLTWLFGGSGNHIGASGVVFGYLGALIGAAAFERRPAAIAPALVAIMLYGTFLVGFVPQVGVSWEGHVFGFLAGLLTARTLAEPRRPTPDYDFPD